MRICIHLNPWVCHVWSVWCGNTGQTAKTENESITYEFKCSTKGQIIHRLGQWSHLGPFSLKENIWIWDTNEWKYDQLVEIAHIIKQGIIGHTTVQCLLKHFWWTWNWRAGVQRSCRFSCPKNCLINRNRISRAIILDLCTELGPVLECPTKKMKTPVTIKVLATFAFFANGMSANPLCRVMPEVWDDVIPLYQSYSRFPCAARDQTKLGWFIIANWLSNVIHVP